MKQKLATEICAALLVVLFVYTALSKFLDLNRFMVTMAVSPFPLMKTLAPTLQWVIPITELLIAVCLITSKFQKLGFVSSAILLVIFEIYIGTLLLSGLHLPCSCGGVISKLSWKQHLFFNLFFIAVSLLPFYLNIYKEKRLVKSY